MAYYSNIGNNIMLKIYHIITEEFNGLHIKYANDQYKLYYACYLQMYNI